MGVKGLWDLFKDKGVEKPVLKDAVIAIDATLLMYAWMASPGVPDEAMDAGHPVLRRLFEGLAMMRKHNARGIFVLDGKAPKEKADTLKARQKPRDLVAHELFKAKRDEHRLKRLEEWRAKHLSLVPLVGPLVDAGYATNWVRRALVEASKQAANNEVISQIAAAILVQWGRIKVLEVPEFRRALFENMAQLRSQGFSPAMTKYACIESVNLEGAHELLVTASEKTTEEIEFHNDRFTEIEMGNFQKLLEMFGHVCVKAAGEAEQLCAQLLEQNVATHCATEDGDAFLFGAPQILRGLFHREDICLKDATVLSVSEKSWSQNLSPETQSQQEIRADLITFGILSGCDYVPKGLLGFGGVSAWRAAEATRIVEYESPLSNGLRAHVMARINNVIQRNGGNLVHAEFKSKAEAAICQFAQHVDCSHLRSIQWPEFDRGTLNEFCRLVFWWDEERVTAELDMEWAAQPPEKKAKIEEKTESIFFSDLFASAVASHKKK